MPRRVRLSELEDVLTATFAEQAGERRSAVVQLCPCHVKSNRPAVWDRVLALTDDPDVHVRRAVFHTLTDGSPRTREVDVIEAIGRITRDSDKRIARNARRVLAHYRRTGRYNFG